ncbi:cilia- and flagella-associated protein 57-like [Cimex lectularius]|uniref:Cilia- and flagella-associated protein 57 n=1 Tax=Cimex lectularius TaxID=79782 RepID=A0A8I6TKB8_CIMLE|nr:cilia- and flagella-associated protein 57-like [Cimex lectularius]
MASIRPNVEDRTKAEGIQLKEPVHKLKPKHFCGLSEQCSGSVQFLDDNRIMYPIGKTIVIDDIVTRRQRYLQLTKSDRIVRAMVLSPDRHYLAVSETTSNKPTITIFSMISLKQVKYLINPIKYCTATQFGALSFTCTGKHIAALIGDPDWLLLLYDWEKAVVINETKAHLGKSRAIIDQIICHPSDQNRLIFIGPEVFRMMHFMEKDWIQYGYRRTESTHVTCACWISPNHLIVGTENGKLLAIEFGNLKRVYNAATVNEIDLKSHDKNEGKGIGFNSDIIPLPVNHLTGYELGFAYTCGVGMVIVFEKNEKTLKNTKWYKRGVYLANGPAIGDLDLSVVDTIQQIAVSQDEKTLICTTLRNEIFYGPLQSPNTWKDSENVPMNTLFNGMHNGQIAAVSSAIWKSIFITAGRIDRTLMLWDYRSRKMKFRKVFDEDIYSAALHPTGFFCLVGFQSKLKLLVIFVDDFRSIKDVAIPHCPLIEFSWGGQIFAAVNGYDVHIISSITLKCVQILKGHSKEILNLRFLKDDYILFSCGEQGSLYKWDLRKELRDVDFETSCKGIYDVAHAEDAHLTYLITFEGTIKEFHDKKLMKIYDMKEWALRALVVSNTESMMFGACQNGSILSFLFPFNNNVLYVEYTMHTTSVKRILITQNELTLITIDEGGALCLWEIVYPEGVVPDPNNGFSFLRETMVTYEDWADKKKRLNTLRKKLKDMDEENDYIMKQMVAKNENNLTEIQNGYKATIADLENKIKILEKSHMKELEDCTLAMAENSKKYAEELENLKKTYQAKVEEENMRSENIIFETKKYVNYYWDKLKIIEKASHRTLEDLAKEKTELLLQAVQKNYCLQKKINELKINHTELTEQLEEDRVIEIDDITTNFEERMATQNETRTTLLAHKKIIMKRSNKLNLRLQKCKTYIHTFKSHQLKLKQYLFKKEAEITKLKREVARRKDQVAKTNVAIIKTIRSQRDFMKEKFVRDVRIDTLKQKLEPLEDKFQRYTALNDELEKVLKNKDRLISRTKKMVTQLTKHCVGLSSELKVQDDLRYESEQLIQKLKNEIYSCLQASVDPKQLRNTLLAMLHRFITHRHIDDRQDPSSAAEFMRQRKHLEASAKNLRSLISRKPRIIVKYKRTCAEATKNHIANLISELRALRRCWRRSKRKALQFDNIVEVDGEQTFHVAHFDRDSKPIDLRKEALTEIWGYYLTVRILINEIEHLSGQHITDYIKTIKGRLTNLVQCKARKTDKNKKGNLIEKVVKHVMLEQSLASEKSQISFG